MFCHPAPRDHLPLSASASHPVPWPEEVHGCLNLRFPSGGQRQNGPCVGHNHTKSRLRGGRNSGRNRPGARLTITHAAEQISSRGNNVAAIEFDVSEKSPYVARGKRRHDDGGMGVDRADSKKIRNPILVQCHYRRRQRPTLNSHGEAIAKDVPFWPYGWDRREASGRWATQDAWRPEGVSEGIPSRRPLEGCPA